MAFRISSGFCVEAAMALGQTVGTHTGPLGNVQPSLDAAQLSSGLVIKTVTAVGMAHRSARRTARRVHRRHGYHHY